MGALPSKIGKRLYRIGAAFLLTVTRGLVIMNELNLYRINLKYVRNLSQADSNVMSISPQTQKDNRPFVGIVILMGQKEYCIPITSPKNKFKNRKSNIDFIKIYDDKIKDDCGVPKLIGVLNLNNMIPVSKSVLTKIDLTVDKRSDLPTQKYVILMQKQLKWCRNNYNIIFNRANKVYKLVTQEPDKNRNLVHRCCNFKKLECVLDKYLVSLHTSDKQLSYQKTQTPLTRKQLMKNSKIIKDKKHNTNKLKNDKQL